MKFFKYLLPVMLVGVMMMLSGCGSKSNDVVTTFDRTGTLQGKIMDATTGIAIGGPDLKMTLIQGTQAVSPSKLVTVLTDALLGEFAFSNIPVTFPDNNGGNSNSTFKIVVSKPGYQDFAAEFSFDGYGLITATNVAEAVFNRIGNIYLYPIGGTAQDVTVSVKFDDITGKKIAVAGATVQLLQDATNSNAGFVSSQTVQTPTQGTVDGGRDTRLYPTKGLLPALTGTTDADGKVVFAGTNLVLGGMYKVVALPTTVSGVQLALTSGVGFVAGVFPNNATPSQDGSNQEITMFRLNSTDPLPKVLSVSPTAGTALGSGVLTINFDRPVVLSNPTGVGATVAATLGAGLTAITANVSAALSADGFTLTLTPSFSRNVDATDTNVRVTYNASGGANQISVIAKGFETNNAAVPLFSLPTFVSNIVTVK